MRTMGKQLFFYCICTRMKENSKEQNSVSSKCIDDEVSQEEEQENMVQQEQNSKHFIPSLESVVLSLRKVSIDYNPKQWRKCVCMKQYKSARTMTVYVSSGTFSTFITVLNTNIGSNFLNRQVLVKRSNSLIYKMTTAQGTFISKLVRINKQDKFQRKLQECLDQVLFLKIAENLKVGPKMKSFSGYDMIIFEDGIEFSMQQCKEISHPHIYKIQNQLRENLKKLHLLKIVHLDIKPSNIAWSPYFQKWVFLDFGFSECIRQDKGSKSYKSFIGTYNYASLPMKRAYHTRKKQLIDLYQNDIFCLGQSIMIISQSDYTISKKKLVQLEQFPGIKKQTSSLQNQMDSKINLFKFVFSLDFGLEDQIKKYIEEQLNHTQFYYKLILEAKEGKLLDMTFSQHTRRIFRHSKAKKKKSKNQNSQRKISEEKQRVFENIKPLFFFNFISNFEQQKKMIIEYWNRQEFMIKAFNFIKISAFFDLNFIQQRKNFCSILYQHLQKRQKHQRSFMWRYRIIIQHFDKYFRYKKITFIYNQLFKTYEFLGDQTNLRNLFENYMGHLIKNIPKFLEIVLIHIFQELMINKFYLKSQLHIFLQKLNELVISEANSPYQQERKLIIRFIQCLLGNQQYPNKEFKSNFNRIQKQFLLLNSRNQEYKEIFQSKFKLFLSCFQYEGYFEVSISPLKQIYEAVLCKKREFFYQHSQNINILKRQNNFFNFIDELQLFESVFIKTRKKKQETKIVLDYIEIWGFNIVGKWQELLLIFENFSDEQCELVLLKIIDSLSLLIKKIECFNSHQLSTFIVMLWRFLGISKLQKLKIELNKKIIIQLVKKSQKFKREINLFYQIMNSQCQKQNEKIFSLLKQIFQEGTLLYIQKREIFSLMHILLYLYSHIELGYFEEQFIEETYALWDILLQCKNQNFFIKIPELFEFGINYLVKNSRGIDAFDLIKKFLKKQEKYVFGKLSLYFIKCYSPIIEEKKTVQLLLHILETQAQFYNLREISVFIFTLYLKVKNILKMPVRFKVMNLVLKGLQNSSSIWVTYFKSCFARQTRELLQPQTKRKKLIILGKQSVQERLKEVESQVGKCDKRKILSKFSTVIERVEDNLKKQNSFFFSYTQKNFQGKKQLKKYYLF